MRLYLKTGGGRGDPPAAFLRVRGDHGPGGQGAGLLRSWTGAWSAMGQAVQRFQTARDRERDKLLGDATETEKRGRNFMTKVILRRTDEWGGCSKA